MTPELIELYKAIQGRIRGLEADDEVFCPRCKYRGRAGGHWVKSSCRGDNLLWLPPVWSEDGRCLWDMVDWERFDLQVEDAGHVILHSYDVVPWGRPICKPVTLPEALLRAMGEQEKGGEG